MYQYKYLSKNDVHRIEEIDAELLLDQIFISKQERNHGIGRELFHRLCQCALKLCAKKLYICSASAEETVNFYRNLGCIDAIEVNKELYALDPRDLQLEYPIHRWRH